MHRHLKRQQLKALEAANLKEAGTNRELKRAKTTKIYPKTFETVVVRENGPEKNQECNQGMIVQGSGTGLQPNIFASQIVIQDHLSALRDRLFLNTQGMEPGDKSQAASHTTSTPLYPLVLDSRDRRGS